jgi:hypothetical protein
MGEFLTIFIESGYVVVKRFVPEVAIKHILNSSLDDALFVHRMKMMP